MACIFKFTLSQLIRVCKPFVCSWFSIKINARTIWIKNHPFPFRYFRHYQEVLCEFIPQMIFMLSIFGYAVALMFIKWIIYTPDRSHEAPSLLICMAALLWLWALDSCCRFLCFNDISRWHKLKNLFFSPYLLALINMMLLKFEKSMQIYPGQVCIRYINLIPVHSNPLSIVSSNLFESIIYP